MFRTHDLMVNAPQASGCSAGYTALLCLCISNFTDVTCQCYTYGALAVQGQFRTVPRTDGSECDCATLPRHQAPAVALTPLPCTCITLAEAGAQALTDPRCLCITDLEEGRSRALGTLREQLQAKLDQVSEAEKALKKSK